MSGKLYVARHFPASSKARMDELVANLIEAYRVDIAALTWMSGSWMVHKRPSVLGAAAGAVAGLVAITPASGYVTVPAAIIIGPCVIGEHAVVGAGSVVTRDVEPYTLVAGNPAQPPTTPPPSARHSGKALDVYGRSTFEISGLSGRTSYVEGPVGVCQPVGGS